jgi:apolipoprotein N-acyltransferase
MTQTTAPAPAGATESPTLPAAAAPPLPGPRLASRPASAAILSGALLWLAFPPVGLGYLGWLALVPLFCLVRSERKPWRLLGGAYLGGLAFWLPAIEWVRRTDPSAWLAHVVMAAFLALWFPAFLALARPAVRRGVPFLLAVPAAWLSLEYLRAYILTGFPWYYLAHTQYRALPVIQVADFAGVWGPSLVVALGNAGLAAALFEPLFIATRHGRRLPAPGQVRRAGVVLAVVALALIYGGFRLVTAEFTPGPRLALLQSNIKQELKMKNSGERILAEYDALMGRALEVSPPVQMMIWPETSFPFLYPKFATGLDDATVDRLAKRADPRATARDVREQGRIVQGLLRDRANGVGVPIVVGATVAEYSPTARTKFNAALLVEPKTGDEQRYDKLHLVPFGEYVPLLQTFPWLTRLTPYHGTDLIPSLTPATAPRWLEWDGLRYATAICFEDTVPQVVRRSFREAPGGKAPDILMNISNDGWFAASSELDMHLAVSVFRCVEHRVPLVRAVNTGISALVDGNGEIRQQLPKLRAGVLVADVPLDPRRGAYTRLGDWLAQLAVVACVGGLVVPRRRRPQIAPVA